jgi:MoxR-like ATPase
MGEAGRAHALISGRPTVGFEDVRAVAPAVLNHRVLLNYKARFDRVDSFTVVDGLLATLDEAALDLPDDVELVRTEEDEG